VAGVPARGRDHDSSLWGAQRKRPTAPAADVEEAGGSPKERHVLDLQQKAGNAAVAGAVQRSLWGEVSDWFGGGDAKGGESGFGEKGGEAKDLGYEQPMGEKGGGFEEKGGGFESKGGGFEEKGGGFKDFGFEEPMGEKGAGGYEAKGGEAGFDEKGGGFDE
jgi:hypothetical protein